MIGMAQNRPRIAISPDGRRLAIVAFATTDVRIWVRSLGALDGRPVEGTDGAQSPFWSPDSRFIGFFSQVTGS